MAAPKPPPTDTFDLAPFGSEDAPVANLPALLGDGAAGQLAAGLQLAQAQYGPFIGLIQAQNTDLARRLQQEQDGRRDDREDHREELRGLEARLGGELAEAKQEAANLRQELAIERLRAELKRDAGSSTFERLMEPLIESVGPVTAALMARGSQPVPVQAQIAPTIPPAPATSAPYSPAEAAHEGARDGAGAGPPSPAAQADPAQVFQLVERAIVQGALAAIRGGASDVGPAVANVFTGALSRAGFNPTPGQLARVALTVVANAAQEGQAAKRVAAALAPVVGAMAEAKALLSQLTPDTAVGLLWTSAGFDAASLTPERRAYATQVFEALLEQTDATPAVETADAPDAA